MAYTAREFDNLQEATDYLNGVVLGKSVHLNKPIYGLHGLTLIINDGAADRTVTFADATGVGLTPKEILNQIQATHANLVSSTSIRNYGHVVPPQGHIALVTATYSVDKDGTANTILGFDTAADSTVTPIVQADIVAVLPREGLRISVIHV